MWTGDSATLSGSFWPRFPAIRSVAAVLAAEAILNGRSQPGSRRADTSRSVLQTEQHSR